MPHILMNILILIPDVLINYIVDEIILLYFLPYNMH